MRLLVRLITIRALVINNIQQKYTDTTIVMVAHRLNTLDNCNKIYQVGGGNVGGSICNLRLGKKQGYYLW